MIPIPTSRVFRSRRGTITWSFWVIVAAVMAAGFADAPEIKSKGVRSHATDALGMPVDDRQLKELMKMMDPS